MVLRLSTRTPVEYESNLVRFIRNASQHENAGILFIDCRSTLTNYLRSRAELVPVFNALRIHSLESMEEFLTLLRSVDFRHRVQHAHYVVVSPFYHLLSETSAWQQKKWLLQAENVFEWLEEKFNVHVVVAEEG
jgi:hypothetical protein